MTREKEIDRERVTPYVIKRSAKEERNTNVQMFQNSLDKGFWNAHFTLTTGSKCSNSKKKELQGLKVQHAWREGEESVRKEGSKASTMKTSKKKKQNKHKRRESSAPLLWLRQVA